MPFRLKIYKNGKRIDTIPFEHEHLARSAARNASFRDCEWEIESYVGESADGAEWEFVDSNC